MKNNYRHFSPVIFFVKIKWNAYSGIDAEMAFRKFKKSEGEIMTEKINKDMTFGELLRAYPEAAPVLGSYGLHCIGCRLSVSETIEQGMKAHGMDDSMVEKLIIELNQKAGK